MIGDQWINNKLNPIVLVNASLYIGIVYYDIGKVYLFNRISNRGMSIVGVSIIIKNVKLGCQDSGFTFKFIGTNIYKKLIKI